MGQNNDAPNPSRRSLLAALPAAALAPAAVLAPASGAGSVPHPDAALLDAVARFRAINTEVSALFVRIADENEREEAIEAMDDDWAAALDDLCAERATTLDGNIARAQALAEFVPHWLKDDSGCWDHRQLAALLRDLLAMAKPGV